jgi:hypothetical protein
VCLIAAWEAWPMLLTADLAPVDHRHLQLVQRLVCMPFIGPAVPARVAGHAKAFESGSNTMDWQPVYHEQSTIPADL